MNAKLLIGLLCGIVAAGCWPAPGASVAYTTTVVYTRGARQNTVSARLKVPPEDVFAAAERILEARPDLKVVNRNVRNRFIEVTKDEARIAAQATDLKGGETLLFVWADTGTSARAGHDIALNTVEQLCRELGISYEIVGP